MQIKPVSEQTRIRRVGSRLALIVALATPLAGVSLALPAAAGHNQVNAQSGPANRTQAVAEVRVPRIQLALILDTSNSMDGLIDQTRNQMWQVVNEFASATQNGITPILEIALYEYGNDGNSVTSGYVRMLNDFTRELDGVSASLFSLTTNGGAEYCGYAIKTAVENLQWSRSDSDIKTIFIAGNEPFGQGPVNYRDAIELANQSGISVNTIHAGGHQAGINDGWQSGALLAGGNYMSIDADQQIVHIVAPQDHRIAELNARLNQTYLPYGESGESKLELQQEQDALSSDISVGLLAKRARSKSSSFYSNSNWDLVDALTAGTVASDELAVMDEEALPEPMQDMNAEQRLEYVKARADERKNIQRQINELSLQRDAYVAEKRREQAAAAPSISDALTGAVKKEAQQKNFVFNE